MTKRKYGTIFIFSIWRIFQAAVVVPAGIVATVLLVLTLGGQTPVRTVIEGIYNFAEQSVRPAPAGMIIVRECAKHSDSIKPPMLCEATTMKEVPVQEAVSGTISNLWRGYLTLVLMSVGFMIAALPSRSFFGLNRDDATESGKQAAQAQIEAQENRH